MKRDNSYLIGNKHAKGSAPNKTSFKKGAIPWNKDKKNIHLSPASEWKKGMKGRNWIAVGTITQRISKGIKRNFIKVKEPNISVPLAVYVWIKKYRFIFVGDIIHHRDGNKLNDKLKNLIALPRTDHPIFDGRWGLKQLTKEQEVYYLSRYKNIPRIEDVRVLL